MDDRSQNESSPAIQTQNPTQAEIDKIDAMMRPDDDSRGEVQVSTDTEVGMHSESGANKNLDTKEESFSNPTDTAHPSHRRAIILAAIGVLLIIMGAGASYFLLQPNSTESATRASTKLEVKKNTLGVAAVLVEGTVQFSADNGQNWKDLTPESVLKRNTIVKTGVDGRSVLNLDDGSAIRLDANSKVKIVSLDVDDVRIENLGGQVYNRIVASKDRAFQMIAQGTNYVAKGTAFRVVNTTDQQGVEVYQSSVGVSDVSVEEGNAYFQKHTDTTKVKQVSTINLESLKQDPFIKWNSEQDKKITEFANSLGVLSKLDEKPPVSPQPVASASIVLTAVTEGKVAKLNWRVENALAPKGFKIVYSASSTIPVFPGSSSVYVSSPSARQYALSLSAGKAYNIRVCVYTGDQCSLYSNLVKVVTAEEPKVVLNYDGLLSLSLSGTIALWTDEGSAPKGYKLVASKSPAPTYGASEFSEYISDPTYKTSKGLAKLETGTWYVRVCKYTGDGCVNYSNEAILQK